MRRERDRHRRPRGRAAHGRPGAERRVPVAAPGSSPSPRRRGPRRRLPGAPDELEVALLEARRPESAAPPCSRPRDSHHAASAATSRGSGALAEAGDLVGPRRRGADRPDRPAARRTLPTTAARSAASPSASGRDSRRCRRGAPAAGELGRACPARRAARGRGRRLGRRAARRRPARGSSAGSWCPPPAGRRSAHGSPASRPGPCPRSARRGRAAPAGRAAPGPARGAASRRPTGAGSGSPPPGRGRRPRAAGRGPRGRGRTARTGGAPRAAVVAVVDAALLEHQADARSQAPAVAGRVQPEDPRAAAVGHPVALDDLDRRRLARAVRPEQREQLAAPHVERDPAQDLAPGIRLAQTVDDDRGRLGRRRLPRPSVTRPAPKIGRRGRARHGVIFAYCVSKSSGSTSPIWMPAQDPVGVDEVGLRRRDHAVAPWRWRRRGP